jgi:hypothetical protein
VKPFEQGVQEQGYSSVETVVRGNTEFALALCQKLRTVEGNLFFSPYSISTALAMTYAGARDNTQGSDEAVLWSAGHHGRLWGCGNGAPHNQRRVSGGHPRSCPRTTRAMGI